MTTYRIIEAAADCVTVIYEFANGKKYQHTLQTLTAQAEECIAAIEAAGREFDAIFDPPTEPESPVASEILNLINTDVELPA